MTALHSPGQPAPEGDLREVTRQAAAALEAGTSPVRTRASTSDLSIDEVLLLHSIDWEPAELVCGVSVASIPAGVWTWGSGEIFSASAAHARAVATALNRLQAETQAVGGHGAVGVHIEVEVERHTVQATIVGTAIRPCGSTKSRGQPFVSDLSSRDFVLLHRAGWEPVGMAFGASFVYAPRRSAGTAITQRTQNVELTNFTEAMYQARELAMERMQESALEMHAAGVVAVQVGEGPMPFAHHAVRFTAWGTAVRLTEGGHQYLRPRVVLPVDDAVIAFDAASLRGGPDSPAADEG